ncbi:MAG TPA: DUF4124 domain-containing protein [Thermodesulfobacteriota bacterium]|nr:DUF4124 domain-containing protein [Thermodesulfobacteriota bacterium]
MKKALILLLALACFIFTSSASATIYRWVDEKGVVNLADDYDKIPPAYRDKVEEVKIAKTGSSTPSQVPPGKAAAAAQQEAAGRQSPPVGQTLVREGDFAVKLAEALRMGPAKGETEAESTLAAAGIMPKNGWIADYPVTPDIIGELQNAVGSAVDSGKLEMNRDEADKAVQDLAVQQGLPVQVDERQNPVEQQPQDYGDSEVVNDYYYTEGPPVVTYYPPPWDYYYLYAWVPCPFWYAGFWFPGFFVLNDFHFYHGHGQFISNHFVDPKTHASLRVDPTTRATGTAARNVAGTGSRGFSSPEARKGATSIFNRSASSSRTSSQSVNTGRQYTGRQYRSFQRPSAGSGRSFSGRSYNAPSSRSFSAASRGGRSSYSGSRSGGSSGNFRSGGSSGSFGGSHGGSYGGGSHGGGGGGGGGGHR